MPSLLTKSSMSTTFAPVAGAAAAAAEEATPRRPPADEDTTGGGGDFECEEEQHPSTAGLTGNRQGRRRRGQKAKKGVSEEDMSDLKRPGTEQFGLHRIVQDGAGKSSRVPQSRLARACRTYGAFPDAVGAIPDRDDEFANHPLSEKTNEAVLRRAFAGLLERQEAGNHERDWAAIENWILLCYPDSGYADTIRIWEAAGRGEPGSKKGEKFPEGCVFRPLPKRMVQSMIEVYTGRRGEKVSFQHANGETVEFTKRGTTWSNVKHFQGTINFFHKGFGVPQLSPCNDSDWNNLQKEEYNMHSTKHKEGLDPVDDMKLLYQGLREVAGWSYLMMLQMWAIILLCISLGKPSKPTGLPPPSRG